MTQTSYNSFIASENDNIVQQWQQLARTLVSLRQEWVSWEWVAKNQEGSESLATELSGLAELPGAAKYFRQTGNRRKVILTVEGRKLAELPLQKSTIESPTQNAAIAVKDYIRHLRPLRFKIKHIAYLSQTESGRYFIHTVQVEMGDAIVPNEAPVTVKSSEWATRTSGKLIGQDAEESVFYVALESKFGSDDLPAYLIVDQAFLFRQLAESLDKLPDIPSRGQSILSAANNNGAIIAHSNSAQVADNLAQLPTPWTRFLWGPPGAGKTYAMGRMMTQLVKQYPHERILIVAPSNVAVDVALLQFVNQLQGTPLAHLIEERQILRYGYAKDPQILAQSELLGTEQQEAISANIAEISQKIQRARKRQAGEFTLAKLRAELLEKQEALKEAVQSHVKQCLVVATTTTQAYMSASPINKLKWDTILIDETTMVPPAVSLYISSLAQKRFLLAGDPRQLGPVYQINTTNEENNTFQWMGRDIYDFTQISTGSEENRRINTSDTRLVQITAQRRCSQDIWQPIQHLYKNVENQVDESQLKEWRWLAPKRGAGLAFVDVSQELGNARCEKAYKSWQNPKTAEKAVFIAQKLLTVSEALQQQPSIGIITPYRAQYRLLKQALKKAKIDQQVKVGTVHQFQGSEADIIIFDLVDGPGRQSLGKLLRGDGGLRLMTVAISRARGKFILLADKQWMPTAMNRHTNPLLWDIILGHKTRQSNHNSNGTATTFSRTNKLFDQTKPTPKYSAETQSPRAVAVITPVNVSKQLIQSMEVGESKQIQNKIAKRLLKPVLHEVGLKPYYDRTTHSTTWRNHQQQFKVDHHAKLLLRVA